MQLGLIGLGKMGFNMRDRSLNNLLYFVYFCAFWLAWIVAAAPATTWGR